MFTDIKNEVQRNFNFFVAQGYTLYTVQIEKNVLFNIYLQALPEEES